MATTEKVVFITFDDGPHPVITPWVQQELQKFQAKATFFCVGENAQKFPAVLDSLQKDGHKLGNHTHNHLKGWNTADLVYVKNILKAKACVPSNLFRPPYGRITPRQVSLLKAAGFKIVMWSLLSCDYLKNLNQEEALLSLKNNTKPGSIVVFHDSEKAKENLQMILPQYLQFLQQEGFICAAL